MASKKSITSAPGALYGRPTTDVLAKAFSTDPVVSHTINSIDDPERRLLARQKLFRMLCSLFTLDDAVFYEATISDNATASEPKVSDEPTALQSGGGGQTGGQGTKEENSQLTSTQPQDIANDPSRHFHSVLILARPGPKTEWFASLAGLLAFLRGGVFSFISLVGVRHFWSIKDEYAAIVDPLKKAYFTSMVPPSSNPCPETFTSPGDYYEIKFIGTDQRYRGKGLCPALVREVQKRAAQEGKPVWMEASNEKARRQYLKCGFEEVGAPCVIGKGRSDGRGEKAVGEEATGVTFWAMVWWPGWPNGTE